MRRAFTIIEMLVVIACIGILATMIVPLMGRLREEGRRSGCAANMRQIVISLQLYGGAFDRFLPPAYLAYDGSSAWVDLPILAKTQFDSYASFGLAPPMSKFQPDVCGCVTPHNETDNYYLHANRTRVVTCPSSGPVARFLKRPGDPGYDATLDADYTSATYGTVVRTNYMFFNNLRPILKSTWNFNITGANVKSLPNDASTLSNTPNRISDSATSLLLADVCGDSLISNGKEPATTNHVKGNFRGANQAYLGGHVKWKTRNSYPALLKVELSATGNATMVRKDSLTSKYSWWWITAN